MRTNALWFAAAATTVLGLEATSVRGACINPSGGYEGFGRNTTGGAGKPVYRVTNLNDSGAGSLRDALARGDRCVVFDVGGTISLSRNLVLKGANVTIDGLTAPSPGITLRNRPLVMPGSNGARNVVVRAIRHRSSNDDGMRIYNASNIVIDRVSISGFGDGAIDITEGARDVTVQWSILGAGRPEHNLVSLISYGASRVTVHHNLYINGYARTPQCKGPIDATSLTQEIVCDLRNNVMWNYAERGAAIRRFAKANVVNNYFYSPTASAAGSIYVAEGASAYTSGNFSKNGWNLNANGNRSTPWAAVEPTITDALTAAQRVLAEAGARGPRFGLDATDREYIGQISLTAFAADTHGVGAQ